MYLEGCLHHSSLLSGRVLFTEIISLRYWLNAWSRYISSFFVFSSMDNFSRIAPLPISPGPSLPDSQRQLLLVNICHIYVLTGYKLVHSILLLVLIHQVNPCESFLILALKLDLQKWKKLLKEGELKEPDDAGHLAGPQFLPPLIIEMKMKI